MFASIFRFEIGYHLRQPLVYVISLILFLLSFGATVSDNISIANAGVNVNINSPYNIIATLSALSFIASLIAGVAYATSPVLRDFDHRVAELFFTTRVRKFDYLLGRFCGSILFCFVVYFAAMAGIFIGEFMPWLDPERLGPTRLSAYWFATWAVAVPNILFIATLVFFIATLTRSMIASYIVVVVVLLLSAVVGSLVDPEDIRLLSMLDPFGDVAIQEITRYWTPFERNDLIVPLEGNFLYNRVMVATLAALFLAAAYRFFPFSMDFAGRGLSLGRKRKSISASGAPAALPSAIIKTDDFRSQLLKLYSMTRLEIYNIVIGKAFLVLVSVGMLQVGVNSYLGLAGFYGTEVYPTTAALVRIINGSFSLPLIAVLVFYSSELLVREKSVGINEIVDSMPFPNWVVIFSKLLGLMAVIAIMLIAAIASAVFVQILRGYYDFELAQYFFGLFSFFQFPIWYVCVLAVFAQVVTGNRYLGMLLIVLYLVALMFLPQQGFDHNLYLINTPQIAYSTFTGFGPNLSAFLWFALYWSLFCGLLLIAMELLWQRGVETNGRFRMRNIRPRFTRPVAMLSGGLLTAFLLTGSYIYYNTNVLNPHVSRLERERIAADYEKAYKQYQDMDFPDVTDVYAEVDIFPERSEAAIRGRYTLRNNHDSSLQELHLSIPAYLTINSLEIPGTTLRHQDPDQGYYIYDFDSELGPGVSFEMSYDLDWLTPGFVNNGANTRLLSNGSFFNNTEAFPLIGYQQGNEILDNNRRRRYDLPPVERMAKIDDTTQWDVGLGTSVRANFEAIVSTSEDQIAVTPGYLEREWQEDGRNYFHYRMDEPIWPFLAFLSADYDVKKDNWNGVDLEVYYKHGVNVDRMLEASKRSLDYFSENFSPYQYRQYRIFEFPSQRGTFAQSFPNTIPFSEAIGFVADIRDPAKIDFVFYVTAHEFAHQWWGHQVAGANVQGNAMLTETLSQYSALMVMEKEYGDAHMQQFLRYELDRYLSSRGSEVLEELPLMLVENQGYIHYRKGSVVLYALKDYLGEESINRVLSEFIDEWAFKGPPYPTSRHLVDKLRLAAGPEYQALISDMFEKIVLFDLRAEESSYRELDDGRFEVTINTSAQKFEANGEGEETQVAVDVLVDIAVLGEDNSETGIPRVINMEKRQLSQPEQRFSMIVDEAPVSVGIDPFNKLIDRNPQDNIKRLETGF